MKSFFCSCEAGYVGEDCSQDPCALLEQCSGHGECLSPREDSDLLVARCDCEDGYTGDKCHLRTWRMAPYLALGAAAAAWRAAGRARGHSEREPL